MIEAGFRSASASGTPPPNIPPASQVVPSIGLDGKPTSRAAPSTDNGGSHFPTAAAVLVGVAAGIAGLVLFYKFYVWIIRRQRDPSDDDGLLERDERGLNGGPSPLMGGFATLPSSMSVAFNGGGIDSTGKRSMSGLGGFNSARSRQASWGGESWGGFGEKSPNGSGEFSPSPPFSGTPIDSPGSANASRASFGGFPTSPSGRTSFGGPPTMPRRSFYSSSASGSQLLPATRTFSSVSPPNGSSPGIHVFPSGNRLSGAPHNPLSRIEVVPPSPLAPPPGSVVATDKSALDFAPSSGVGKGSDGAPEDWVETVAAVAGHGEAEERVNPAFDGSYAHPTTFGAPQHSFSPSIPSIPSSSAPSVRTSTSSIPRSSTSIPRPRQSNANLRSPFSSANAVAASANSSDSSISASSSFGVAPPVLSSSARPAPALSISTSSSAGSASSVSRAQGAHAQAAEPKSPLERLQMRVERERKGLSSEGEAGNYGRR
ncbi:hypothetical protein Rt10032_c11g4386 [Rhodotorula toruloides]|uniref:Uncharacterized protein n=1 Tax=Rhodotorula toruloides TaxID=5286 RepID=A0A511KJ37_RHOTO|nr:hypothetical protein Rt10032_c11g4386 [Rhodotorula toruloides]